MRIHYPVWLVAPRGARERWKLFSSRRSAVVSKYVAGYLVELGAVPRRDLTPRIARATLRFGFQLSRDATTILREVADGR